MCSRQGCELELEFEKLGYFAELELQRIFFSELELELE